MSETGRRLPVGVVSHQVARASAVDLKIHIRFQIVKGPVWGKTCITRPAATILSGTRPDTRIRIFRKWRAANGVKQLIDAAKFCPAYDKTRVLMPKKRRRHGEP